MEASDNLSMFIEVFQFKKIMALAIGFFLIFFAAQLVKYCSKKLEKIFEGYRLALLQISTVLIFIIYIGGTLGLVFVVLKPTAQMLTALGAAAGFALGFASQDLVGSIVAGIILLFDRPFQVGDRVQFGEYYGEITSIGLRAVRLQTLDDNQVTIPNAKFVKEAVSSGNAGSLDMMVVCQFHLSMSAPIEKTKRLLYEVVATSRFVYLKKPIKVIVEECFIGHQLVLKFSVKAYVFDVLYEKDLQSDIFERGIQALDGADLPRPQSIFNTNEKATPAGDSPTI